MQWNNSFRLEQSPSLIALANAIAQLLLCGEWRMACILLLELQAAATACPGCRNAIQPINPAFLHGMEFFL
jgi:hypothetical protein